MRPPFTRRSVASVCAASALAAALAAPASADTVIVNVLGHDFSINPPGDLNIQDALIHVGDTIRWNFTAPFHTTTSCTGTSEQWDSSIVFNLPFTYDHTFTHTGVFHYYCGIHGFDNGDGTAGGMSGTITVMGTATFCDSIDFNGDTLFPDTQDIEDFLSVFSGGTCSNDPNCGDIDFNNDGLFPDTLDIDSLLSVFSGGACI